ncbi:putative secreted protein [Streptomyces albus]|uniref:Putative secreted protein n=1 Tax=Streptomyces albus (strain ATCC 21838 / DSM 41398 / FERM P-419 / JCM 4703 / NBRC 107858) TaxID=1081613 RepID=A0A0B5F6N4_STRA4|nr:putative secreted protein [Streptomyces albus]AOU81553.1 putative secreted protein [Streptomyces albus]
MTHTSQSTPLDSQTKSTSKKGRARHKRRVSRKHLVTAGVAVAGLLGTVGADSLPSVTGKVQAAEKRNVTTRFEAASVPADGGGPKKLVLPPLHLTDPLSEPVRVSTHPNAPAATGSLAGVPRTVLAAYHRAVAEMKSSNPGCRLPVALLAAIGKVESGHARGGAVDSSGTTLRPILGPELNGSGGFAAIRNIYGTKWGQSGAWARAVGPMQFIPSTWARWGSGGNPSNVHDAALAAGRYLCANGRDLSTQAGLREAILSYNHSTEYLNTVSQWMKVYSGGILPSPDGDLPVSPAADHSTGSGSGAAAPAAHKPKPKPQSPAPEPKPEPGPGKPSPKPPHDDKPGDKPGDEPGKPKPGQKPGPVTTVLSPVLETVDGVVKGVTDLLPIL